MKKKLAILLVAVFAFSLCFASVAYAAPGPGGNGDNTGGNLEDRIQHTQERLGFLETIQPLVQEMVQNRGEIKSLSTQLREQVQLAKEHLQALRGDIDNVTPEQLQELEQLRTQLFECRRDLVATNANMSQLRNRIRNGRQNRNYEDIENAYNGVIGIQQQRMDTLQKMIQLNQQICQI